MQRESIWCLLEAAKFCYKTWSEEPLVKRACCGFCCGTIEEALLLWQECKNYLAAMSCAANYAWVNRSSMTFLVRQAFQKLFKQQADDLDMHVVYDVSHNIAKVCHEPGLPVLVPLPGMMLQSLRHHPGVVHPYHL